MNEKKNNSKKLIALLVAVMLLIGCAVGGTIAWLMAETKPVVNTFTAGDINIKLEEPNYVAANDNKLVPGGKIAKDPTVTVLEGSEPCYVRVWMIISWSDDADNRFEGTEANGWFNFGSKWKGGKGDYYVDNVEATLVNIYEFRYEGKVDALNGDVQLDPLFTEITVPGYLTGDKYDSIDTSSVTVIAQAVQAEGFDNADAAFDEVARPAYIQNLIDTYYPEDND